MTKAQIISEIESGNYYYNHEDQESYSFWKQAVKKVPEFVKNDIAGLRAEMMDFWGEDFFFSKEFAEILKPLNLEISVHEN